MENEQKQKNAAAVALGRRARGVKKTITEADREGRRQRMLKIRQNRKPALAEPVQTEKLLDYQDLVKRYEPV